MLPSLQIHMFAELCEPKAPLFPPWSSKHATFTETEPRKLHVQLRRMLRGLSKAANAQLAYFRHCLATAVGKGDRRRTEQVSALLNHSARTSIERYDLSNRRKQRTKAVLNAIKWLKSDEPFDFVALPGRSVSTDGDFHEATPEEFQRPIRDHQLHASPAHDSARQSTCQAGHSPDTSE